MEKLLNITSSSVCPSPVSSLYPIDELTYPPSLSFTVVGQEELDNRAVNIRNRDDVGTKSRGEILKLDDVVEKLLTMKKARGLSNKWA